MKIFKINIIIAIILFVSCKTSYDILSPVVNENLRNKSDKLIYDSVDKEFHSNITFNGAYEGVQCQNKIENFEELFKNIENEKYKKYNCICYQYKISTDTNTDLYIGTKSGYYLNTNICYESNDSIAMQPKIYELQNASKFSKTKHIQIEEVKRITRNAIKEKSKLTKFPALVYHPDKNRTIWKVRRYFGRMNMTIYEFEIDGLNGKVLKMDKVLYKRNFWQWISGTGI